MSDEVCKNKGKPFNNYNVRNDAIVAKPIIDSAHKDDINISLSCSGFSISFDKTIEGWYVPSYCIGPLHPCYHVLKQTIWLQLSLPSLAAFKLGTLRSNLIIGMMNKTALLLGPLKMKVFYPIF